MLYINTRTGLIFDASSEITGDEIELYETEPVEDATPVEDAEPVEDATPVEETEPVEKPKKGRKKNS